MNRLDVWKFALAAAVTFAALSAVCAVAVVISPDATIAVFNNWFQDLKLSYRLVVSRSPLAGLFGGSVLRWSVHWRRNSASCYNLFSRTTGRCSHFIGLMSDHFCREEAP
jgi:hypothetical protein